MGTRKDKIVSAVMLAWLLFGSIAAIVVVADDHKAAGLEAREFEAF